MRRLALVLLTFTLDACARSEEAVSFGCDPACAEGEECVDSVCQPLPTEPPDAGEAADAGPDGGGFGALTLDPAALPSGKVGTAYSVSVSAAGGTAPYAFALGGGASLPAGLTLDSFGKLSGTPTTAGTATFDVQATDSSAPQKVGGRTYTLAIDPATGTALALGPDALADAAAGQAYSAQLTATGGTGPYTFGVASGSLPAGLTMSAAGLIAGTPSTAGSFDFVAQVSDASSPQQIATRPYTLLVTGGSGSPLQLTTSSLPSGKVGAAYTAALTATGGTAPYTFSVSGGTSLPSGLALDAQGNLSGTPTTSGTFNFVAQVTDASAPAQVATAQLSIGIAPASGGTPLSITTTAVPAGTVNVAYSVTFTAAGGTAPYNFSLGAGSNLPAGLTLSPTGALSGTPTTAGTFSFTLQVSDASTPAQLASAAFSLTIAPAQGTALVFTTSTLPDGKVNTAYQTQLTAGGGTTPYRFALAPGSSLPSGLYLDSQGNLKGTPLASGRTTFTATVTDASNPVQSASRTFTLTVLSDNPASTIAVTTTAVPNTKVGAAYTATLTASGGNGTYSWSLVTGALPTGLTLSSAGVISGTATNQGTYAFTVQVKDTSSPVQTAEANLSISVIQPVSAGLTVTTGGMADAQVGAQYKQPVHANGGTAPYSFSITAGALPPGMSLVVSTGANKQTSIEGTTDTAGTFKFTLKVTDAANATASKELFLYVLPAAGSLELTTTNVPDAKVGLAYSFTLDATGGTAPYAYTLAGGNLPTGLALAPTGTITGTPTSAGSFAFIVQAADATTKKSRTQLWITVVP